mmetsp:Transcript_10965/g.24947  ORF Transcript_10965/g.24947 Transcript_10965/m.24947 type:complete len:256 (-) Transcript_10965:2509-3276(-)
MSRDTTASCTVEPATTLPEGVAVTDECEGDTSPAETVKVACFESEGPTVKVQVHPPTVVRDKKNDTVADEDARGENVCGPALGWVHVAAADQLVGRAATLPSESVRTTSAIFGTPARTGADSGTAMRLGSPAVTTTLTDARSTQLPLRQCLMSNWTGPRAARPVTSNENVFEDARYVTGRKSCPATARRALKVPACTAPVFPAASTPVRIRVAPQPSDTPRAVETAASETAGPAETVAENGLPWMCSPPRVTTIW